MAEQRRDQYPLIITENPLATIQNLIEKRQDRDRIMKTCEHVEKMLLKMKPGSASPEMDQSRTQLQANLKQLSEESIVLLKNANFTLPLPKNLTVLLVGNAANELFPPHLSRHGLDLKSLVSGMEGVANSAEGKIVFAQQGTDQPTSPANVVVFVQTDRDAEAGNLNVDTMNKYQSTFSSAPNVPKVLVLLQRRPITISQALADNFQSMFL